MAEEPKMSPLGPPDEKLKIERPEAHLSNFIRILKFGDKLDFSMMAICTASAIGAGIAMPMMFYIFGNIVSDFVGYFMPLTTITKDQFLIAVNRNTTYMIILACVRFFLSYISILSIRTSGLRISSRIRLAYMKALFNQSVSKIDTESPAVISSRLTENSNTIESGISQHFSLAIQAISFTIGLFVISFLKSIQLTFVALASVPIVIIAFAIALPLMYTISHESNAIRAQASSLAYESFQSIRIVTAFGAGGKLGDKHRKILDKARLVDHRLGPVMSGIMAPMFFTIYAIFALTFWRGIKLYSQGKIDNIGSIIVVLFSVMWAVMSLYHLYNPLIWMTRAAAAASEVFEILDGPVSNKTGFTPPDPSIFQGDLVFRNVEFSYPSRPDSLILNQLNVVFESGQVTAIVGPSGSGKSTIVGLIERWYEPSNIADKTLSKDDLDSTHEFDIFFREKYETISLPSLMAAPGIYIADVDLKDLDIKWWRSNIGLVQQEPFLFNDTIFQNVANGLSGTKWEHAEYNIKMKMVQDACCQAFADEFISQLPQGFNTSVGEGGMRLSGGQRQRLAIARAIVKSPAILILDEATSAIDVRSERIVQQALDRASKGRTTIVIAHRLSTIRKANKILVVKDGIVVEEGTHAQLLQHGGAYSGLVRAQEVVNTQGEDTDSELTIEGEDSDLNHQVETLKISSHSDSGSQKDKAYREKGFVRSLGFLVLDIPSKRTKALLMLTLVGAVGGGAAYPLQAYLFGKVVEVFTFARDRMILWGNFWAVMFFLLAITTGFSFLIIGWSAALTAVDMGAHYRQEFFQNVIHKRIAFFDKSTNSAGSLTAKISTDAMQIQQILGGETAIQIVGILGIIGSLIIAFYYGWKLSMVGSIIMPIVITAGYYRVRLERDVERGNAKLFAETAQFSSEAIGAFRTVAALTMEDSITQKFEYQLQRHTKDALKKARVSTVVMAISESIDMFCQALFFWYGGQLLSTKEYNILAFFVVYMAIIQSAQSLGMWFTLSPNIAKATAAANEIIRSRSAPSDKKKYLMPIDSEPASIEFNSVTFTYPDRGVPVLRDVSFKIKQGQFAAFVGASGSGKSTIISLMEGFYDATAGQIAFDGLDIASVDLESYRQNLSLVAQEATLYEGTIWENVALSVDDRRATHAAIEEACKAAQIHNFIVSLPHGYCTQIGSKGVALSGGQRQRLALARALLRRPQLLLLDEATSNLDSESEKLVQQAIEQAAGRRTVVVVAHRLATIRNADVIFVVGSGRILESGNHETLIAERGLYYQMCQVQSMDS